MLEYRSMLLIKTIMNKLYIVLILISFGLCYAEPAPVQKQHILNGHTIAHSCKLYVGMSCMLIGGGALLFSPFPILMTYAGDQHGDLSRRQIWLNTLEISGKCAGIGFLLTCLGVILYQSALDNLAKPQES